ncbi:MAG: PAS domain-containing protein, partial [Thauera sp.]|nr:PAS domain-containing protein [Thauera sp.]
MIHKLLPLLASPFRSRRVRWAMLPLMLAAATAVASLAKAQHDLLSSLFQQHTAVMMFIEPVTGRIVDANAAADRFYGYGPRELIGRSIDEINALGADEVAAERARAQNERRNYFVFPHRLANGEIRTVEVYSSPVRLDDGQLVLFSIIHDITGK